MYLAGDEGAVDNNQDLQLENRTCTIGLLMVCPELTIRAKPGTTASICSWVSSIRICMSFWTLFSKKNSTLTAKGVLLMWVNHQNVKNANICETTFESRESCRGMQNTKKSRLMCWMEIGIMVY